MMNAIECKDKKMTIKKAIKCYENFPKEGVLFRDIFPLFQDSQVFSDVLFLMSDYIKKCHEHVDYIIGLEARGFLIGPALSLQLGVGFIPIRKAGKLPGDTLRVNYALEYREDALEMQADVIKPGQKVIIVDDLLATGGTLRAACELLTRAGAETLECLVIIELMNLGGRQNVPGTVRSLVQD